MECKVDQGNVQSLSSGTRTREGSLCFLGEEPSWFFRFLHHSVGKEVEGGVFGVSSDKYLFSIRSIIAMNGKKTAM